MPDGAGDDGERHRASSQASGIDSPPYLTLTIPEAAVLPDPPAPEPRRFETVLALLDHRAEHKAEHVAAGFPDCPREGHAKQACLAWTYSDLRSLSLRLAKVLAGKLGRDAASDPGKQPVVALLAPSGPEFLLHALACWRLGAVILPIALGTTAGGAASLIEATACRRLLFHPSQAALAKEVEETLTANGSNSGFRLVDWSLLEDVTSTASSSEAAQPIFDATPDDVLVIFHSSGSTGNPKPIPQLIRFWTQSLVAAAGCEKAAFTTTPLFHGGLSDLFRAMQAAAPIFFFAWQQAKAPTASSIVASVAACTHKIAYFLSVPFILEMLSEDERGVEMMKRMDLVSTGGAPLPEEVGDAMTQRHNIKLVSRMGSSECGFLMSSWRRFDTEKDWSWLRRPKEAGPDWLHFETQQEEPGVYELVVQERWPTKLLSNRDGGKFATGDLYEQHPKHIERWHYARRADDAIVMVNGKKIASAAVESRFKSSGLVEDVIVFGANRPLLGALVLPSEESSKQTFRKSLASKLGEINRSLPSHARVPIEMIHVVDRHLLDDLPKSSKGTLQRGLALQQLSKLIDGLYERFEEGEAPSTEPRRAMAGAELRSWLTDLIADMTGKTIDDDADFFENDIDSIMAARIRAAAHQRLDLGGRKLTPNVVYEHPNVALLAAYIESSRGPQQAASFPARAEVAERLLERYASRVAPLKARRDETRATVLVTGATGALGTRVLEQLCQRADVGSIICVARASTDDEARSRVARSLKEKKCEVDDETMRNKIKCICSLHDAVSRQLQSAGRLVIIHCAWIVNFALRLESFEKDCIAPLRDLLELYGHADNPCRFVFCSSIASVMAGSAPQTEQPSGAVSDSGKTGYGQSKWVAEKICEAFGEESGISIARVGQLCGDTRHGIWNETEAWPLLVRSADEVGCLPATGPDVDWLPVDTAASAVVDLAFQQSSQADIAHVTLPQDQKRLSWPQFLNGLKQGGLQFDTVGKTEWLGAVKSAGTQVRGRALLEIWESLPDGGSEATVETKRAEEASLTLQQTTSIDEDLCARFVQAWRASGFLN